MNFIKSVISKFLNLKDVLENTFTNNAYKQIRVNSGESGIEFVNAPTSPNNTLNINIPNNTFEINNSVVPATFATIPNNANLNNYIAPGYYAYNAFTTGVTNLPTNFPNQANETALLVVYASGSNTSTNTYVQLLYSSINTIYIRTRDPNNVWLSWETIDPANIQQTLSNSNSNKIVNNTVERAALTGDVSAAQNSNSLTIGSGKVTSPKIANNAVGNTKLADMAYQTIKGRKTTSTGDPQDLTPSEVRTILNVENGAQAVPHEYITNAGLSLIPQNGLMFNYPLVSGAIAIKFPPNLINDDCIVSLEIALLAPGTGIMTFYVYGAIIKSTQTWDTSTTVAILQSGEPLTNNDFKPTFRFGFLPNQPVIYIGEAAYNIGGMVYIKRTTIANLTTPINEELTHNWSVETVSSFGNVSFTYTPKYHINSLQGILANNNATIDKDIILTPTTKIIDSASFTKSITFNNDIELYSETDRTYINSGYRKKTRICTTATSYIKHTDSVILAAKNVVELYLPEHPVEGEKFEIYTELDINIVSPLEKINGLGLPHDGQTSIDLFKDHSITLIFMNKYWAIIE